jgi:hypothetical protein
MATVSRSASISATQLLGVISTTASTLTTIVGVVGNAADVLNDKSMDWLAESRKRTILNAQDRDARLLDETAISISQRIIERNSMLERNADLKAVYLTTLAKLEASLTQGTQQQAA